MGLPSFQKIIAVADILLLSSRRRGELVGLTPFAHARLVLGDSDISIWMDTPFVWGEIHLQETGCLLAFEFNYFYG